MAPLRTPRQAGRVVVALFIGATLVHARLGEDEAGCDLRYNPHGGQRKDVDKAIPSANLLTGPGTVTRLYSFDGWVIAIGFREGRAARVCYQHEATGQRFVPAGPSEITAEEATAILKANSAPGAWREIPAEHLKEPAGLLAAVKKKANPSRLWVRADGAIAYLNGSIAEGLYLEDRAYVQEQYRPPGPAPAPKPVPRF